jgi:hypothetical protein
VKILMRETFVDSSPTSSLNYEIHSFGYIEYDVPWDLSTVEKRMFFQTKLPLLTRNNFHAIGSYDNDVFMVHRVYIYSYLNPHSLMQ